MCDRDNTIKEAWFLSYIEGFIERRSKEPVRGCKDGLMGVLYWMNSKG